MSNAEFGRRINRAPSTVPDIFTRESIDTKLLLDISTVLGFNFFTLYTEGKQLGEAPASKDKISKLIVKNDELAKTNLLLNKKVEQLISILSKNKTALKKKA